MTNRPGNVAGVLVDATRDLSMGRVGTAARLKFTGFTVVLAGAINNGIGFRDMRALRFNVSPSGL